MNKAAFLIDGHLEQLFIQHTCPGQPVRRINCNGHNVVTSAIARRIATLCRLFNNNYFPIVVIIDREDRDETSSELCSSLYSQIKQEGITDAIIVGVADRMIENWILADTEIVNQHPSNRKCPPLCSEGLNGKNVICQCIRQYHETTLGVELLLKCRASYIKKTSPSFAHFYNQLPKKGCHWLSR